MTENFIPVNGTNPTKNLETSELTDSNGVSVHREGVFIGDPSDVSGRAAVSNSVVSGTDYGLVVRPINGFGDLTTDAWGVPKVSIPKSLYHGLFTFDIPANMWLLYENGAEVATSTAITSENSAGTLRTTATEHTLVLESRECPRYQPNRGHLFSTAVWMPSKTNDGVRELGLGTTENCVCFRLKSDGNLYAARKSGGVLKYEELIDVSGVPGFDVEKGNIYDIQAQWRGLGNYKFFINNVLVHTMELLGTLTELSIENPALPIRFMAQRITEDVEMHIGCADITSENGLTDTEQYGSTFASGVTANTDTPVLVVYNPLQINGQTNTRTITLARVSVTASKKAVFTVWRTRDATAITGATLVEIGGGSFVQTDSPDKVTGAVRATSVTKSKLAHVTAVPVEATVAREIDNPYRGRIEFPVVRGDYLVVTCTAAAASADCVIEWGEQI